MYLMNLEFGVWKLEDFVFVIFSLFSLMVVIILHPTMCHVVYYQYTVCVVLFRDALNLKKTDMLE